MINALLRQGAEVIYEKTYDLHTSGHAQQDELKLMLALTKPRSSCRCTVNTST